MAKKTYEQLLKAMREARAEYDGLIEEEGYLHILLSRVQRRRDAAREKSDAAAAAWSVAFKERQQKAARKTAKRGG